MLNCLQMNKKVEWTKPRGRIDFLLVSDNNLLIEYSIFFRIKNYTAGNTQLISARIKIYFMAR